MIFPGCKNNHTVLWFVKETRKKIHFLQMAAALGILIFILMGNQRLCKSFLKFM